MSWVLRYSIFKSQIMNIFIDESGEFYVLENAVGKDRFGCIVAVVLSDDVLIKLEEKYGDKDKETLRRFHAKDIVEFLCENNCKVFLVVHDSFLSSGRIIQEQKEDYIKSVYEATENHPDFLDLSIEKHTKRFSEISDPQYIKALLMILLLENILRGVCCQSTKFLQDDLKTFKFICDTETNAIVPIIKHFTHLPIFCNSARRPVSIDNAQNINHLLDTSGKYLNGKFFFKNINFTSSNDSMGVRIADVVANQIFRILNNKTMDYDVARWEGLCSNPYSFECIHFNKEHEFIDARVDEKTSIFAEACSSSRIRR